MVRNYTSCLVVEACQRCYKLVLPLPSSPPCFSSSHAEIVNYGFVGGWGIRLWTKYGTVYNMRGNKGLAIALTDGNKFLIGTQKPEELTAILEKISARNIK